ncbi:hypothetical protein [Brevibacterium casei]|uniref:Uncharacterized protein n=1 Tax=Brevibacterium casei TaxID=33889 RepID=A0A7T2THN5_9MICO|nr:hypothetical protein [Brevibacterium casei]QPS33999.1 hypothetical protein I6G59_01250 [Brevibacterium casei]
MDKNDWKSWALLSAVINNLEALSERVTDAGAISDEDIKLLAESVDHLKEFRQSED